MPKAKTRVVHCPSCHRVVTVQFSNRCPVCTEELEDGHRVSIDQPGLAGFSVVCECGGELEVVMLSARLELEGAEGAKTL